MSYGGGWVGALKMQDMKLQDMKLLYILVVMLFYVSARMFNSLLCTNCFDELFFLHLFLMSCMQMI